MKYKARLEPGKVAVVTGGSSGIGKAIARLLVEKGMDVWLVAQRQELLESARIELEAHRSNQNQVINTISADISNLDQVRGVVKQITETSGAPDLLVNSAGVTHPGYVQDLDVQIFRWMMEVNYFGTVYMIKEFLPAMIQRKSGYILNVSSMAGLFGVFGYSAYGGSKFAIKGLSDVLWQELKLLGIGVSILFPSDTDTPQLAYENQYKPPETIVLASKAAAMTADDAAKFTIKAIERGKYVIIPSFESNFWYILSRILGSGGSNWIAVQMIASAAKKKTSTHQKEG